MSDAENKTPIPQLYAEDEISLYDLYRILARHSKLILFVFVAAMVCGTAYVLFTPKFYQASVQLRVPLTSEVYLTNLVIPVKKQSSERDGNADEKKHDRADERITNPSPEQVFSDYLVLLASDTQWQLFRQMEGKLSQKAMPHLPPGNPLTIDGKSDNAIIKYNASSPAGVAKILERYFTYTQSTLIANLHQQLEDYLSRERATLNFELQVAREYRTTLANKRAEKLAREVALAKKLHVLQNLRIQFNETTESSTLDKEFRLALLNRVKLLQTGFRAYHLDGNIVVPAQPVKPRKKLILVLSAVLGLFLGIFAAFVAEFFTKLRAQDQQTG